ncbi:MAG: FlgO family outer membrane protein [bacterium]
MLTLLTFGGLSLVDEGVPVSGAASQRSRLALLAVLAVAGAAGVSRDKLLALLWPESEDERARHALKQAVYALRRDLGTENAIVGTATLSLDAAVVSSDVREFEDALARGDDAASVALYNGPFLDGVFVKAAPEFDQWAAIERSRLERAYLDAVGRLGRAADAAGDVTAAVQWWRRAAAAEPLSGRVAMTLMRALAESGDTSAAIQHARVHDAMVRAELDVPADDAVLAFAEELRRGDWTPTPRVVRDVPVTAPALTAGDAPVVHATSVPSVDSVVVAPPPRDDGAAASAPRPRWMLPVVAVGALLVVAVGSALMRGNVGARASGAPAAASPRIIVVAAFENQTREPQRDSDGEMAADHIARALIEAEFHVVDYWTSMAVSRQIAQATQHATVRERAAALAAETGAGTVVTGSYYLNADTLQFEARIIDPSGKEVRSMVGPVKGRAADVSRIVTDLANQITERVAALTDTKPGASTASLIVAPSVEAFEHASRGWEMFFDRPADTTAVFAEFARALRFDTAYTTPRLMRAYVLDVKENWPDLANAVAALDPRRARMGRVELAALSLFEADLRGDLAGRLRASRELLRLSPGSADMSLLVAVSASYLHRPAEALEVLHQSSPDRGISILTPMYLAWRAEAEHSLGQFEDEAVSAREMMRRFPGQLYGAEALARSLGARGDTVALAALVRDAGSTGTTMTPQARTIALLGARELRAHGHGDPARQLFARAAAIAPVAGATRDDLSKYAFALYETGDHARSRAAYRSLLAAQPSDLGVLGRLGSIAARTGDSATVRDIDSRLRTWPDRYAFGGPSFWRAHLAALTGQASEAVGLLHSAQQKGYRLMDLNIVTMHEEPDFISIWNDPGFREIVRPHGGPVSNP